MTQIHVVGGFYLQGHEDPNTLAAAFLMSKKNATFLHYWYRTYKEKYVRNWGWNAVIAPYKLAKTYPHLIHVEGYNFTTPNAGHKHQIFKENYKWDKNYGMHLYLRFYNLKNITSENTIRRLNTTIGSVCRHILFGNKDLCSN